jgi:hypothetical protein
VKKHVAAVTFSADGVSRFAPLRFSGAAADLAARRQTETRRACSASSLVATPRRWRTVGIERSPVIAREAKLERTIAPARITRRWHRFAFVACIGSGSMPT